MGLEYRINSSYAINVYDYYFFEKNLQGDIVAIYNEKGTKIASYTYDAWGVCFSTFASGTSSTDRIAAIINPFRYRGYYLDVETELYCTATRYYDPEIGRFINADNQVQTGGDNDHMLENNLFAFCFNNPVNMTDEDGQWPKWATKVLIGVAVIAAVAVVTVATGGAGAGVRRSIERSCYWYSYRCSRTKVRRLSNLTT